MKRVFWKSFFFGLIAIFGFNPLIESALATPDLRGTYIGSGTQTWWNCVDSISNGTYQTEVVLIIDNQNGNRFTGTATETSHKFGLTGKNYVTLSGGVDSASQFSGSFSSSLYIENKFDSSGEGTFSGSINENLLTAHAVGQDIVGDTCSATGTWNLQEQGWAQVTANLSDLDRVPVFNQSAPNDKNVMVTLSPSPLPTGTFVTLELVTIGGLGEATFDNGQKTISISSSTSVKIRGVTKSSEKDNIKLIVRSNGAILDEVAFSVMPINFTSVYINPIINFLLNE